MKFSKTFILLTLITILAAVLRFWHLGSVPPSPDWDEAALGYNAFSILHTGRDEYGKLLPVVLRSFDDYKPALYVYLIIPFIKLFGLSVWVTRFPSALFGVVTVVSTFFLVKEFFKKNAISLITAFIFAISPWSIQFSHAAFEANVGVTCNILGLLFFLKGIKKPFLLLLSAAFLIFGMYVYQSEKVFVPLLIIAITFIYFKQILQVPKKYIAMVILFGIILLIPLASYLITNKYALARAQGVSIFSDTSSILQNNSQRLIFDKQNHDIVGLLVDNRRFVFAKQILANYLSHFDFNWLFITGDISRHHAPGMGLMYVWELPFLLVGVFIILFTDVNKKTKLLLFSWFFLVPIPASVTTGVPHAIRTINFLPLFQIFTAAGVYFFYKWISNIKFKIPNFQYVIYGVFTLLFIFNFIYYLDQYYLQQNYFNSEDWQYGYSQTVSKVKNIENKYKRIIVSNQPYMDQSYMFFLFYLQYSPQRYQQETMSASGGFRENHVFGKYQFRPIIWEKEDKSADILFVGRISDFPPGVKVIQIVNFLDRKPAIEIVQG